MNKLRRRILTKLAQMEAPGNLPSEKVTETKTVSGAPTPFDIVEYYPNVVPAFGNQNYNWIRALVNTLNQALYYTSDGQVELKWMQSNNFNFGTTVVPSVDLKNLMNFAKQVHNTIFTNNGTKDGDTPLKPDEIAKRIAPLKSSSFISNLSNTNPMGQLSSKIGGNVKTLINNILLQIR